MIIHLIRKPLSESTVAENTVVFSCGGINIDGSRIPTTDNLNGGAYAQNSIGRHDRKENWRYAASGMMYEQPTGRFPSNVILYHTCKIECNTTCPIGFIKSASYQAKERKLHIKSQTINQSPAFGKESRKVGHISVQPTVDRYFYQIK